MELLPCPFCGSNKIDEDHYGSILSCSICHTVADKNIWNTRTSPWISVKDELPKGNDEIVLAITDAPKGSYPEYLVATYSNICDEWYSIEGYVTKSMKNDRHKINHWMPLPQPPKETE